MKQILTSAFLTLAFTVLGQTKEYQNLVKKADSLYKVKEYLNSGKAYSLAFKSLGWKGTSADRYNAACTWSLASVKDSAFFQLERIVQKANYTDYDQITTDKNLSPLHHDSRWIPLINKIKENRDKSEASLNKKLMHFLDSLVKEDQKWRGYWAQYNNKQLGIDTISEKFIVRSWRRTDSLNYFHLRKIFEKYGFPNYDLVGQNGSGNFWLLIQHQDAHPQFQEEVLNKMKAEADKGKASWTDYAYLLDRVKVNTNQLQVYGTQMKLNSEKTSYEPKPLIEPEKVNERRKSVGLDTLDSYIQSMNSRFFGTLNKN